MSYTKPLPDIAEPVMAPFWSAARQHRLSIQRCPSCHAYRWPPLPSCPECLDVSSQWIDIPAEGVIWSYVVYHRAFHPGFEDDIPYVVGVIELESGVRIEGAIVDRPGDVEVGKRVIALFDDVTPEVTLLKWQLVVPD
jgi:uncharacterized OB-fold protein